MSKFYDYDVPSWASSDGKYVVYREALEHIQSDRILYLAMPSKVYKKFFKEPIVKSVFSRYDIKIILYKTDKNDAIEWVK